MHRRIFLIPIIGLAGFLILSVQCNQPDNFLEALLKENLSALGSPALQPDQYDVQIIYTQIDRDSTNRPSFKTTGFRVDQGIYFYPASTVKMPTAILALEKINRITSIDETTDMVVDSVRHPQSSVHYDSLGRIPNIKEYVERIFLVSDNNAFNRLYEFMGQEDLNQSLYDKGFKHTRIIHRLSRPEFDYEANQYTNPVYFLKEGDTLYAQPEIYSRYRYPHPEPHHQIRGSGYLNIEGELVEEPFDFSNKNFISLQNLHDILKVILFPEQDDAVFQLNSNQYHLLYSAMSLLPNRSSYPEYQDSTYRDNYVKYLMYGDRPYDSIPDHIKIYNKIGAAYGTLTDVAYIIDTLKGIEFILAATVHVNRNKVYNDGVYEYDEIGLPFLGNLGRVVYQYELERHRKHIPDFNDFLNTH